MNLAVPESKAPSADFHSDENYRCLRQGLFKEQLRRLSLGCADGELAVCIEPWAASALLEAGYYRLVHKICAQASDPQLRVAGLLAELHQSADLTRALRRGETMAEEALEQQNEALMAAACDFLGRAAGLAVLYSVMPQSALQKARASVAQAAEQWLGLGMHVEAAKGMARLAELHLIGHQPDSLAASALIEKALRLPGVAANGMLTASLKLRVFEISALYALRESNQARTEALEAFSDIGYQPGQALVDLVLGSAEIRRGRPGTTHLQSAAAVFEECGDLRGIYQAHSTLASASNRDGDVRSAIDHYDTARKSAIQMGFALGEGFARIGLLQGYARCGHMEKAMAEWSELSKRMKLPLMAGALGVTVASTLNMLGLTAEAEAICDRAIAVLKKHKADMLAEALAVRGSLLSQRNEWAAAGRLWRQALRLDRQRGENEGAVRKLQAVAQAIIMEEYSSQRALSDKTRARAVKVLDEARAICERAGAVRAKAGTLQAEAQLYICCGQLVHALRTLGRARLLYEQDEAPVDVAFCDALSGLVLHEMGRGGQQHLYSESIEALNRSITCFKTLSLPHMEWQIGYYLALAHFSSALVAPTPGQREVFLKTAEKYLDQSASLAAQLREQADRLIDPLREIGLGADENRICELAIKITSDYLKSPAALKRWRNRAAKLDPVKN